MTFRSSLVFLVPLLAGCSRDAAVDVEFFSTPPVVLTRLDLHVARADGGTEDRSFVNDAGFQLPTSLQVLVSESRLDLTATGFEAEGQAHLGAGGTTLTPGPKNSLRVELASSGWCPSPPPGANTVVAYGDAYAANWEEHGYAGNLIASPSACTGTSARRYPLIGGPNDDGQYDGFLFLAPTAISLRLVSMRLRSDVAQTVRVFVKHDDVQGSPSFTLPNPTTCTDSVPWACVIELQPGVWKSVSLDVPANLPTLRNFQIQALLVGRANIDIDDLRLEPR